MNKLDLKKIDTESRNCTWLIAIAIVQIRTRYNQLKKFNTIEEINNGNRERIMRKRAKSMVMMVV